MIEPWKKIAEKVEYVCRIFQVLSRQSASPISGEKHPYYVISTQNWVNVIALTEDKKVLLVTQFRHGTEKVSLEIPGGAVDAADPSPLEAAKRELLEETGHAADHWHFLGQVQPNPAILNNLCYFFLATGARPVAELKLDESEELEVSQRDLKEIPEMIRSGKIQHALVVAAFQFFELFRKVNPEGLET